jgi:hypothetical protein
MNEKEMTEKEAEKIALSFTDDEMIELAEKMTDSYTGNNVFWIDLNIHAENILGSRTN